MSNIEPLGLRVSADVKAKLEDRAKADQRSLSSYVRKVLTELVEVKDHESK